MTLATWRDTISIDGATRRVRRGQDLPAQRPGIRAGAAAAALASPRGPRSAQHHAADGPAAQPAGSDDRIGGGAREIAAGELPGADSVMVGEAEGRADVVEVVHVLPIVAPERVVARNIGAVTIGGVSGEDICGSEGGAGRASGKIRMQKGKARSIEAPNVWDEIWRSGEAKAA